MKGKGGKRRDVLKVKARNDDRPSSSPFGSICDKEAEESESERERTSTRNAKLARV